MGKEPKYTFIKGALPTVVWNPKTDTALAEFIKGVFTSNDPKVAEVLREMGYKEKSDYPDGPPSGGFEPLRPAPREALSPGGLGPTKEPDIVDAGAAVENVTISNQNNDKSDGLTRSRRTT